MILTVDLGTTVTKVAVWDARRIVAIGRAEVPTFHPRPGWDEQDPERWWSAFAEATREAVDDCGRPAAIEAMGFAAARQTFVLVTGDVTPIGSGLVWSDSRARAEASAFAGGGDIGHGESGRGDSVSALHRRTGIGLDARSVAAKCRWLSVHDPTRWSSARFVLSPRDLIVFRLTGEIVTDWTLASASGLYDLEGQFVVDLGAEVAGRLAPPVASDTVVGHIGAEPARQLGLPAGVPIVVGAGDRACEVIGTGATPAWPMVSWGTTANVSIPVGAPPAPLPDSVSLTRGALGGWLLEAGLAAAGSMMRWLEQVSGRSPGELAVVAASSPPGANGVLVAPWLGGARAPWWRDEARGAIVGLEAGHTVGDVARAVVEAVAWDVRRCLSLLERSARPETPAEEAGPLSLAGGADVDLWPSVLTAVCGRSARRRRSGQSAAVGAALLVCSALGQACSADELDPIVQIIAPDPESSARYQASAASLDGLMEALLDLPLPR